MYSLTLAFAVVALGIGFLVVVGKLNWIQFAAIALVLGLLFMFVPAIIQHSNITKDMDLFARQNNSKVYYSETDDKYYDVKMTWGWNPLRLYDITEIQRVVVPS